MEVKMNKEYVVIATFRSRTDKHIYKLRMKVDEKLSQLYNTYDKLIYFIFE